MGCGQSKNQIGISPGMKDTAGINAPGTPTLKKIKVKGGNNNVENTSDLEVEEPHVPSPRNSRRKKNKSGTLVKKNSWVMGSQDSLGVSEGNADSRGGSATSKNSHHSADSGFDDHDYQKMITENSNTDAVKTIEDGFQTPRGLDLGIVGKPCPQRFSAKDKERMDEQRVIAKLREEGLITRPMSRAAGGLAFEVTAENCPPRHSFDPMGTGGRGMLPPIQLAKLERRKKRRRKLTEEDIKAKLERAEERRKEAEQQRLEKIQAVTMNSNVRNALDSFAEMQKSKESESTIKVDQAAENREKRLKEMRDKLKAKQEHAENVRRRRKLTVDPEDAQPPIMPARKFTEDTPIGVGASQ